MTSCRYILIISNSTFLVQWSLVPVYHMLLRNGPSTCPLGAKVIFRFLISCSSALNWFYLPLLAPN